MHRQKCFGSIAVLLPAITVIALVFAHQSNAWDSSNLQAIRKCRSLIEEGNGTKALKTLSELVRSEDPRTAREAMYLLADVSMSQDPPVRAKTAISMLDALASSSVKDKWRTMAAIKLAELHRGTKRERQSVMRLEEIVAEGTASTETLLTAAALGNIYLARENWKDAVRCYKYALALNDSLGTGSAHIDTSEIRANMELAYLKQAADGMDEAEKLFNKAEAHRKAEEYPAAIALYKQVIRKFPENVLSHKSGYRTGTCYARQERVDEAMDHWKRFIAQDPAGAYRGLAGLDMADLYLERLYDPDNAKEVLSLTVKQLKTYSKVLSPDWSEPSFRFDLMTRLGLLAYIEGNKERAVSFFREAAPYEKRVSCNSPDMKRLPTPTEKLITAVRSPEGLVPSKVLSAGNRKSGLVLVLGRMAYLSEDYARALELFQWVADNNVDSSAIQRDYAVYQSGHTYYCMWDYEKAARVFATCAAGHRERPWHEKASLLAGVVQYSGLKDAEAGREHFQKLAKSKSSSKESMMAAFFTAVTYYWDKDYKTAAKAFSEFMKKYPDNPWKQQILKETIPDIYDHLKPQRRKRNS